MKSQMLKMANVKSQREFYKLYPTEADFLKVHGKDFKKLMRGDRIKKAQQGGSTQEFNQMSAGMNSQADVSSAIGNLSTGTAKKTTGQTISGLTSSIPILGKLVSGITGLFDAGAERKRQVRAGQLSDLQLAASQSAPRAQNRKYNRPDMDANVADINSLMPAEGTGDNLLAQDGKRVLKTPTSFSKSVKDQREHPEKYEQNRFGYKDPNYVPQPGTAEYFPLEAYMLPMPKLLKMAGESRIGQKMAANVEKIQSDPNLHTMGIAFRNTKAKPNVTKGEEVFLKDNPKWKPWRADVNLADMKVGKSSGVTKLPNSGEQGFEDWMESQSAPDVYLPQYYRMTKGSRPTTMDDYRNGGEIPQAQLGGILGGILGKASSQGGGGSGIVGNLLGGILGNKDAKAATTGETTTLNPNKQIGMSNITQGAQTVATGLSAIPGMNTKMAQSSKSIGEAVGSAIPGPIGAIASPVLGALAQGIGAIAEDKSGKKAMDRIQRNQNQMASAQAAKTLQGSQSSFMRTGGNLRQNSSDMEQDGELITLWGGEAESISYNPHLPDGGETVMFRGKSHDESDGHGRTGIGVRYGEGGDLQPYDANVEVEGGEPAVQLPDETGDNNLVVFGNLPIPNQFINQLGDPDAKGKKFKNYVALLSKQENKQNKIMEKASDELSSLEPKTPYDKIKFDTLGITLKGADQKLKALAEKKNKAASLQQAINDTAEERGIDAEQLVKGRIKAIKGATIPKAQTGDEIWKGENYQTKWVPKVDAAFSDRKRAEEIVSKLENYNGEGSAKIKSILSKEKTMDGKIKKTQQLVKDGNVKDFHRVVNLAIDRTDGPITRMTPKQANLNPTLPTRTIQPLPEDAPEQKEQPEFFNPLGTYLPSNREDLDPRQLTGEYYALATNQLEPVPAQQYHPDLKTPYEISLQDILNENTAATRGAQRFMANNPAAQANLVAQQYQANQKVLGDQFRINQEAKTKVYDENTNILNDAQLKNLGILDTQYQRQAKALSNTKDTAREALSSISDKYLQNQLQNRTLGTYENLYNYRYDGNQHAWNMNQPANFDMSGSGMGNPSGWDSLTPEQQRVAIEEAELREARKAARTPKRNGAILKAMRNL